MLKDVDLESIQTYTSEKLRRDKSNKSVVELTNHKGLVEETRSLAEVNPGVKQLNGVKGVFIKETQTFSNMFQWDSSNIFEIYEADDEGNQLDPLSKPILYSVAKLNLDCCHCGDSNMAITTKLDDNGSDGPFLFMSLKQNCCGSNVIDVYLNDQGNSSSLGTMYYTCGKRVFFDNNYIKNFEISEPSCPCSMSYDYNASDSEGNQAKLVQIQNCCSCSNPFSYRLGFPPNYNQDQNALILCMAIVLGFQKYDQRQQDDYPIS